MNVLGKMDGELKGDGHLMEERMELTEHCRLETLCRGSRLSVAGVVIWRQRCSHGSHSNKSIISS